MDATTTMVIAIINAIGSCVGGILYIYMKYRRKEKDDESDETTNNSNDTPLTRENNNTLVNG